MFKKGTKIYSIINNKCPRCQEGNFFKYKLTYTPGKVTELHEHCSNCNLKYMIEPSFFYGAMYVGYGITVAICIAVFIISFLIFGLDLLKSFAAILIAIVLLMPINLRLSRMLWIQMFISYEEKKESDIS
ncbi:hypothetical protein KCTC32516_00316 [Polaribacter huanghezhanensis]|uniref:DUF983 domain-containing protein n=1 Tax=Polaribacter huanghezhanensis TaxID=1354726 RepID=UPI00264882BE|nr:DUF983 domain-containing protein [Polaribacter huanghezhanensis]WKD84979.1 hypothetical protein KCTC32516_00316 [Polaribacter huanghezhanensis]